MPAKAVSGRSSLTANQTTSFFLVSGFGSGAYSANELNGTRQRSSALSQRRQCGEVVVRIFVTGGYGDFGGGGMPQRIIVTRDLCRCCALPERGNRETRPALAREVAYIAL